MSRENTIILIGGIDKGNPQAIGGEIIKNRMFIKRFNEVIEKVITVDTANWKKRPWGLFDLIWKLIIYHKAKVVISCAAQGSRFMVNLLFCSRLRRGADVVMWWVGGRFNYFLEQHYFDVNKLKWLNRIVVQGEQMVKDAQQFGLNNVIYVPNSKPIVFHPDITDLYKYDGRIKFVFLSRINKQKGILEIFEACRVLNRLGFEKQYSVSFYGKIASDFEKEFKDQVEDIKQVDYCGYLDLSNEEGYKTLSDYDVMLFPTYWAGEGFPGVLVDAFIAGLPIIASDHNLNKEVVKDKYTGWIIPPHNADALSEAMVNVIKNNYDLKDIRKRCLDEAKRYDYQHVLSKDLFKQLNII